MMIDDIATYLAGQGIGTVGTNLFKGMLPASPDNCVALFEYGGERPDLVGTYVERPKLNVRVRNTSYSAGRSACGSIIEDLHTVGDTTLSGTRYLYIMALQSPIYLGRDGHERAEWSINFQVVKEGY
jgi:hypothetical protein